MPTQRQISKLDELMDGALTERFNAEFSRVLRNCFDPNTNPKAKRRVQITIDMIPNERRDAAEFKFLVKGTIAPPVASSQTVMLHMADDGTVTATELTDQIPGQVAMDESVTIPTVVEFNTTRREG